MKRLFLFSSFDKDQRISPPLVYYIKNLSKFGDVIFVSDNSVRDKDLEKIVPYTIHTITDGRHGEYDWGSYKRARIWAKENGIWENYDKIYFVNDSVYLISPNGTTAQSALGNVLAKIEQGDVGAAYYMRSKINNHFISKIILRKLFWNSVLQSWFIGISRKSIDNEQFENFISTVGPMTCKRDFISRYEVRFSHLCRKHRLKKSSFLSGFKNWPFRKPIWLYDHGCPFIKKNSVGRPNSKVNIQEFAKLNIPETQMILDELKFQIGDDCFAKMSKRNCPYIYKRFMFYSTYCKYDENECYIRDNYLLKWRIFRKH